MPRTCIFCNATPVTKEHVWPVWLRDLLGGLTIDPFVMGRFGKQWNSPKINVRVKRVCAECNNEWLSDIETEAQPILTPMILGQDSVVLASADQQVLVRWVYKTALMANLAYPKSELGVPYYTDFRLHRRPPDQCAMWTAAYGGGTAAIHLHRVPGLLTDAGPAPGAEDSDPPPDVPGITITFNLFHAIFQVLLYEGIYRPSHTTGDLWFRRLWPVVGPFSWPPNGRAISHESLERFAFRSGII